MSTVRHVLNGVRVTHDAYVVSGDDDGLMRGRAVFETLRTFQGRVFRTRQHVERLAASALAVGVAAPDIDALVDEVDRAVEGYDAVAKVNIILTGGGARLVRVGPLDLARVGAPVRVATRAWEPPPWLDGRSKHCSRALSEAAVRHAGVDEVLWVGRDGTITEATRSNVFAVVDGTLFTPPDDGRILSGVTRGALLDAARGGGLTLVEAPIPADSPFEELYVSSTLKDLAPVIELNGAPIEGAGPLGQRLARALQELMQRECA